MRILKFGYNHPAWSDQVTCKTPQWRGCGAVLEVFKEDLSARTTHDIGGRRMEAVVICPQCQTQIVYGPAEKFDGLPEIDMLGRRKGKEEG
jgi:hypothetical protein